MHSTRPEQTKRFKFPTLIRNIVLVVFVILILDILVVGVWVTFLSKQGWYDKGGARTLSDLLFIEGAMIFAAGSFMLIARSKIIPVSYETEFCSPNLASKESSRRDRGINIAQTRILQNDSTALKSMYFNLRFR